MMVVEDWTRSTTDEYENCQHIFGRLSPVLSSIGFAGYFTAQALGTGRDHAPIYSLIVAVIARTFTLAGVSLNLASQSVFVYRSPNHRRLPPYGDLIAAIGLTVAITLVAVGSYISLSSDIAKAGRILQLVGSSILLLAHMTEFYSGLVCILC